MNAIICDDHPIFRRALLHVLEGILQESKPIEVATAKELRHHCEHNTGLDLLFLDLELADAHGLALISELLPHFSVGIAILSASESPEDIQTAIARGACGFIPKSTPLPIMRNALQLILSGGIYIPPQALSIATQGATHQESPVTPAATPSRLASDKLTKRQREILVLASRGLSNKEIGRLLTISENTIKAHLRAIYKELNVTNRTEATMIWVQNSK